MTYELAKKLKDAGFPQDGLFGEYWDDEGLPAKGGEVNGKLYIPTLSELIEACGGHSEFRLYFKKKYKNWRAISSDEGSTHSDGSTPEEAVANLWLELNKEQEDKDWDQHVKEMNDLGEIIE